MQKSRRNSSKDDLRFSPELLSTNEAISSRQIVVVPSIVCELQNTIVRGSCLSRQGRTADPCRSFQAKKCQWLCLSQGRADGEPRSRRRQNKFAKKRQDQPFETTRRGGLLYAQFEGIQSNTRLSTVKVENQHVHFGLPTAPVKQIGAGQWLWTIGKTCFKNVLGLRSGQQE